MRVTIATLDKAMDTKFQNKQNTGMSMEQESDVLVVDQMMLEKMTETERRKFLHELFMSKKTFTLHGVKCVYDSNQGPDSMISRGSSGEPKS